MNASDVFYVNDVQLPLALAINKALGELGKGILVKFHSTEGSIVIDAKTVDEFVEKVLHLAKS